MTYLIHKMEFSPVFLVLILENRYFKQMFGSWLLEILLFSGYLYLFKFLSLSGENKVSYLWKIHLFFYFYLLNECMSMCHNAWGQRTTFGSSFLFFIIWLPGIGVRLSALVASLLPTEPSCWPAVGFSFLLYVYVYVHTHITCAHTCVHTCCF